MMGQIVEKVSIEGVLRGIGLEHVETVDPLDLKKAEETVRRLSGEKGVKAVIFRSPCIAVSKPQGKAAINPAKCVGCRRCITEIGCPALTFQDGKAGADPAQCTGCGLCAQICPVGAIEGGKAHA